MAANMYLPCSLHYWGIFWLYQCGCGDTTAVFGLETWVVLVVNYIINNLQWRLPPITLHFLVRTACLTRSSVHAVANGRISLPGSLSMENQNNCVPEKKMVNFFDVSSCISTQPTNLFVRFYLSIVGILYGAQWVPLHPLLLGWKLFFFKFFLFFLTPLYWDCHLTLHFNKI